ncbi:MAG: hypothetical protein JW702_09125, partial [Clostridiales bacterium]|nr:hypothetical protein [Clostridiales bacterium]
MGNPECFGAFWEGTSKDCKKCDGNAECLKVFQQEVLLPFLAVNPNATPEQIGEALGGLDPKAIKLAMVDLPKKEKVSLKKKKNEKVVEEEEVEEEE